MSPEVVQKKSHKEKVDIWGIGIVTHILLSGYPPFDGASNQYITNAIINKKPMFGGVRLTLTPQAKQFTTMCLEKDPDQRPSAEELFNHPWL